ncbi:hypothetical protein [Formosa sp. S-31]|uniref:hypothetical protein n=1 Tax=Formosa sp. S-31 TaxID=2790949 RepID=UPI003EB85B4C
MIYIIFIQTDTEKELFRRHRNAVPRSKEFIIHEDLQYIVDFVFHGPGKMIRVLISPTETSFFKEQPAKNDPLSYPLISI